jgi:hypothetical protein
MAKSALPTAAWWSRCLLTLATYILAADFLPTLFLLAINSIGYLPYSDRPGHGWQAPRLPILAELKFFVGFAALLLPASALCGSFFAIGAAILSFCRLPRWALRTVAFVPAFLAGGLLMAGVGWYIAISTVGVYFAAGCAGLWGLFIFPALVPTTNRVLPYAVRLAIPVLLLFAGTYFLVRTMLPDPGLTNAKIEVVRRDSAGVDLSKIDLSYIELSPQASGPGTYVSANRMEFKTDSRNQLRLLLIVDDDRAVGHTFALPRSGYAIYRQTQGRWAVERAGSRNSKLSLQLESLDGKEINLQVQGSCCSSMTETVAPYR